MTSRREAEDAEAAAREIGDRARRKRRARAQRGRSAWLGLGVFGLVGWSVAVPTMIGVALGLWLDARTGGGARWTLALLLAGVAIGCLTAFYWVSRESRHD